MGGGRPGRAAAPGAVNTDLPFLAIDLGASSGRAVLGRFGPGRLELTEIHRFESRAVALKDTVFWDFLHLWADLMEALSRCAGGGQAELAAVGVDSWNLDFGLIGEDGMLLANPISYRAPGDAATGAAIGEQVGEQELYEGTGLPVFPLTGLARLLQLQRGPSAGLLDLARWYLPIPDLVRYYLTGKASIEQTISWGTQLVDIRSRSWNERLIASFGLRRRLFPDLVAPGTVTGTLSRPVGQATGVSPCPVIAVAEHDTTSAAFTAAALDPEAAILSVGTWSIFGCLLEEPVATREACRLGFMNEIACGRVFLARNLMGFYVLEELIRVWRARGIPCEYEGLAEQARAAPAGGLRIDPNDPLFFAPANVQEALREYCGKTGQMVPDDVGVIVRGLYEGLAASYAKALRELRRLTGGRFERIVVVGGGVRSPWFCQLVADACRVELIGGPAEAAVVGNLCVQALALGRMRPGDLEAVLRHSFPVRSYRPSRSD